MMNDRATSYMRTMPPSRRIRTMLKILLVLCPTLLAACVGPSPERTFAAPTYQPANANVRSLQEGGGRQIQVGDFSAAVQSGQQFNTLQLRAWTMRSPYKDSYVEYLREAASSELIAAGRLNDTAPVTLSSVLLEQLLDPAIGKGTCTIKAQFTLRRDQAVLFEKVLVAQTEWESSFFGNIAIPLAAQGYPATVAKLLGQLYSDREFQSAAQQ